MKASDFWGNPLVLAQRLLSDRLSTSSSANSLGINVSNITLYLTIQRIQRGLHP
ncbi:MAG TPA: hypothetical protein V6C90_13720 [Coleofasciculaceae cyanobacterium]